MPTEIDLQLIATPMHAIPGISVGTDASAELVSVAVRRKAASEGNAMSDGSFPIRNAADLARAIQAFGRAKDKARAKRHIIKRARDLGKVDMLPDSWKVSPQKSFELIGITALDITMPFSADPPQCQFSEFAEGLPKTQKCKFGDESATKRVVWADGRAYIPVCEAHLATARKVIVEDNHDEVTKIMDLALEEFVKAPGPCSLDKSAKHNWVERQGGLPNYICQVARAVARGGRSLDSAIPIAIGTLKKWAAGLGEVSPAVRARAAAAIAQWMKMRAKEKASSGSVETFELDDDDLALIDLIVFADYEFAETSDSGVKTRANSGGNSPEARSKRPYTRQPAGSGSKSGEFAPGKARDDAADKRQKASGARVLYDRIMKNHSAVKSLSDADLKKATGILYSEKTSDPDVVAARKAVAAEMAKRGFDIEKHGAKGGGVREKNDSGSVKKAPSTHNGAKITRGPFEDGSAEYEDGWGWDGEEGKFKPPGGKVPLSEIVKKTVAVLPKVAGGGVKVGNATDAQIEVLKRAGWKGRPGDKVEALYPPSGDSSVETEELGARDTSNIRSRVPNKSNTSGLRRRALPESERPEDKKAARGTGNSRRRGPYRSSGRTVVRNRRKVVLRLDGKPDGRSLRTNYKRYPSSAPSGLGGQFAPEGRGGRATKKKYGTAASLEDTMLAELAFVPFNVAAAVKQAANAGSLTDKQLTTVASVLGKAPENAPGVAAARAKISAAIEKRKLGTKKAAPAPDKKAAAAEVEELAVGDYVTVTGGPHAGKTAEIVGRAPRDGQFMVRVGDRIGTVDKDSCEQKLVAVTASGAALWNDEEFEYFWDEASDTTARIKLEDQTVQVFDGSLLDWTGTDLTAEEVRELPQVDDSASLEALVGAGGPGDEEESAPVIVGEAQRVELTAEPADETPTPEHEKREALGKHDVEMAKKEDVETPEGAGEGGGGKFRIPLLIPENTWSGDRRRFAKGSLEVKEPPFPLLWQRETDDGHKKSVIVGRVDKAEVLENGGIGNLEGVFDTHPDAVEAARQVKGRFVTTVSGDVDKFDHELAQNDEGKETIEIKHGRVVAATIVAKPAFQEAVIEYVPEEGEEPAALVASAGPLHPTQAWFTPPKMDQPYMFTVEDDGRCHGLIAQWGIEHTGNPNWKAPKNFSGYRYFNRRPVRTAEGTDVRCGQLTLTGGHPELGLDPDAVVRHYDDTRSAVADVVVGENEFGIWAAGAMRPDVSPEQIRAFRASEPSGDWRMRDGELELLAVCMVNTPGFPVMQPRALVASGNKVVALVAAGMPSHVRKVDLHAQVEQLSATVVALQSEITGRLATLEAEAEARRRMELAARIETSCA